MRLKSLKVQKLRKSRGGAGANSQRSIQSNMSEARRQKLLNLQKREKLKALLVRKFRMKYGNSKKMDAIIMKGIDSFIKRKRVTEKDLEALGRQLAAAAKQLGKLPKNASLASLGLEEAPRMAPQPIVNVAATGGPAITSTAANAIVDSEPPARMAPSASAPNLAVGSGSSAPMPQLSNTLGGANKIASTPKKKQQQQQPLPDEQVPEDWTLIFRYQQKLAKEERQKELRAKAERRRQLTSSFEEQQAFVSKKRNSLKKLDMDYAQSVQANMKVWKQEENAKKEKRRRAIQRQKEIRAKQVRDRQERACKLREDQQSYDLKLVRRIERENKIAQDRERQRKIDDKKRLVAFLAGNAEHRKWKEEQRKKEHDEDVERMKQYAAILDKQEEDRKAYFAGRSKRQAAFMAQNVAARKSEFEANRARELRDLHYQKLKEDADLEKERKVALRRRKKQQEINNWLNDTISRKKKAREHEKSMYLEINEYAKQQAAKAKAEEDAETRKRREAQKQYQRELRAQVEGREHLYEYVGRMRRRKYANMSERERALNKSLIQKIKSDAPELLSPVKSPPRRGGDAADDDDMDVPPF